MSYIKTPNLPTSKVKTVIVSDTDRKIVDFIKSFGIETLFTKANPSIDVSISKHADINAFYSDNRKIILDKSQEELSEILENRGVTVKNPKEAVCGLYPKDCLLNCAVVGNRIITRVVSTDKTIIDDYKPNQIIDVKQGYTRCSICIVNENAIITDDPSIYKACQKQSIEALLIDKGDIVLPGHDYGFIGGASSLIDKDKMLFFGDIRKHRDFEKIDVFLKKHGCKYDYLSGHALTDIGGMVLIEEE